MKLARPFFESSWMCMRSLSDDCPPSSAHCRSGALPSLHDGLIPPREVAHRYKLHASSRTRGYSRRSRPFSRRRILRSLSSNWLCETRLEGCFGNPVNVIAPRVTPLVTWMICLRLRGGRCRAGDLHLGSVADEKVVKDHAQGRNP